MRQGFRDVAAQWYEIVLHTEGRPKVLLIEQWPGATDNTVPGRTSCRWGYATLFRICQAMTLMPMPGRVLPAPVASFDAQALERAGNQKNVYDSNFTGGTKSRGQLPQARSPFRRPQCWLQQFRAPGLELVRVLRHELAASTARSRIVRDASSLIWLRGVWRRAREGIQVDQSGSWT